MENMIVSFPIVPTEPAWSTNQDRKMNKYERHRHIRAWQDAAIQGWQVHVPSWRRREITEDQRPGIVHIQIPFLQKRKRDPHNYCGTVLKAVIDGLVKAELWPDDTPEWVGHREPVPVLGTQGVVFVYPK